MSVDSMPVNKPKGKGLEQQWNVLISVMFGIFMINLESTLADAQCGGLCSQDCLRPEYQGI